MIRRGADAGFSLVELIILLLVVGVAVGFVVANWGLIHPASKRPVPEQDSVLRIRTASEEYARQAREDGHSPAYPRTLDDAPVGAAACDATPLFTTVMPDGIREHWHKVGVNQYRYDSADVPDQQMDQVYFYEPASGKFSRGPRPEDSFTRVRAGTRDAVTA